MGIYKSQIEETCVCTNEHECNDCRTCNIDKEKCGFIINHQF